MEVDMTATYLRTAGIALLALLACPRVGNAAFMDIIWEMSGHQMFTVFTLHCEYALMGGTTECRIYDGRFAGDAGLLQERTMWLTLGGAAATSTGKNSEDVRYRAFKNHMLQFEPMLEVRSTGRFHHGVGLSY